MTDEGTQRLRESLPEEGGLTTGEAGDDRRPESWRPAAGWTFIGVALVANPLLVFVWMELLGFRLQGVVLLIGVLDLALFLIGLGILRRSARLALIGYWCLLPLMAEVGVRTFGFGPEVSRPSFTTTAENRPPEFGDGPESALGAAVLYRDHPTVGFSLIPGTFRFRIETGLDFVATHVVSIAGPGQAMRITRSPDVSRVEDPARPQVWVLGCSYTYGIGLNDDETYPWLLQERFPDYDIVNLAVPAYGTLQSLIQFREALAEGHRPDYVVLAYAGFHEERINLSRSWRAVWTPPGQPALFALPWARFGEDGRLEEGFGRFPLRRTPFVQLSGLANIIHVALNQTDHRDLRGFDVAASVVDDLIDLSRSVEAQVVVAGIERLDGRAAHMLDHVRSRGVPTVDISVDESLPENTNRPHDHHPSPAAARVFAQRLGDFLADSIFVESDGHG